MEEGREVSWFGKCYKTMTKSKHILESPGKLVKHMLLPKPWLLVPSRAGKEVWSQPHLQRTE